MSFLLFNEVVTGKACARVYDHYGRAQSIGRYQVAKIKKLPSGHYRETFKYFHQRPAAIAYARRWLADIASPPAPVSLALVPSGFWGMPAAEQSA